MWVSLTLFYYKIIIYLLFAISTFHGDGFPFPANPYNRCLAEAALSYLPEGDPMEYAAAVGWQGLSSTISLAVDAFIKTTYDISLDFRIYC